MVLGPGRVPAGRGTPARPCFWEPLCPCRFPTAPSTVPVPLLLVGAGFVGVLVGDLAFLA
eukprot:14817060-Heterocapsa_arctica.AAC.1